jgi:hypothetical protein
VVEHFENGPNAALREAARVLRSEGMLLASVPYSSPVRRAISALGLRKGFWRPMSAAAVDLPGAFSGRQFWQYAFTPGEFTHALGEAGFRVVARLPYAVVWGLYELPFVEQAVASFRRRRRRGTATPQESMAPPDSGLAGASHRGRSFLTRLVVSEDRSVPVLGRLVALLGALSANMMMFVAIKDDRPPVAHGARAERGSEGEDAPPLGGGS